VVLVDVIIKEIIDIDKRAGEILEKARETMQKSSSEKRAAIEAMRSEIIADAHKRAQELYRSMMDGASDEARRIGELSNAECSSLEIDFLRKKSKLEDSIFLEIIKGNAGDDNGQSV
jgi:vacuolar-type H+-ATPase subunit H